MHLRRIFIEFFLLTTVGGLLWDPLSFKSLAACQKLPKELSIKQSANQPPCSWTSLSNGWEAGQVRWISGQKVVMDLPDAPFHNET